jgi:O-antigen/teichoic acid export membrane protein
MDIILWPAGSILQGMARHRRLAVISIGFAIANLSLSILLVRPLGVTGVALGTLIPISIECVCFVLPYGMRVIGVGIRTVFREVFIPTMAPIIPMSVVLYLLRDILHPASLLSIAAISAVGLMLYATIYLTVTTPAEQQAFRRTINHLILLGRARLRQS